MKMIRVGLTSNDLVLMFMGFSPGPIQIPLTQIQAADLARQIQNLLPEELLNVELGASDDFEGAPV